ncbi:MAG: hypothetical protein CTR53_10370 [Ferrovibrio sp.]|nr:MAG: hypothetical protein CTR53_10370 [Ferrovibrio sp.]
MSEIQGLVQLWITQNQVTPHLTPNVKKNPASNPLFVDRDVQFLRRDKRGKTIIVTDSGIARLIAADLYLNGYKFTPDNIKNALYKFVHEWVVENDDFESYEIPRVVQVKKRGRPRKDGTSRTVYVRFEQPKED